MSYVISVFEQLPLSAFVGQDIHEKMSASDRYREVMAAHIRTYCAIKYPEGTVEVDIIIAEKPISLTVECDTNGYGYDMDNRIETSVQAEYELLSKFLGLKNNYDFPCIL